MADASPTDERHSGRRNAGGGLIDNKLENKRKDGDATDLPDGMKTLGWVYLKAIRSALE